MRAQTATVVCLTMLLTAIPAACLVPTAGATSFAVLLSGTGDAVTSPTSVSIGADGNGLAAWTSGTSAPYELKVARRVDGQGWSPPRVVSSGAAAVALNPDTAVTPDGFLAVAWHEDGPTSAYAAIFDPTRGWGASTRLNLSAADSTSPRVTASGPGTFAFFWRDNANGLWEPVVQFWNASAGWMAPDRLATARNVGAGGDVAGDGRGGATVVWAELNGTETEVWTVGPSAPPMPNIPTPLHKIAGALSGFRVEQGPAGRVAAGWYYEEGSAPVPPYPSSGVFVATLEAAATSWRATEFASNLSRPVFFGQFTLLPEVDDEVLVAFDDFGGGPSARVRGPSPGFQWGPTVTLPGVSMTSLAPAVGGGADPATLLWVENDGSAYRLSSSSYQPSTGWTAVSRLAPDAPRPGFTSLAADPRGGAWALFVGGDGNAYVARVDDTSAPTFVVDAPAEGSHHAQASCWVRVSNVWGAATVEVNGVRAHSEGNRTFAALVPLQPGPNRLFLAVGDVDGTSATATINVTYDDPLAPVEADLNETRLALNQTQQELTNTTHEVGHWLGLYHSAVSEIANLSLEVNDTQTELNGTNEKWLRSQSGQIYLESQLTLAWAELNTTKAAGQQQESDLAFARQRAESASSAASTATLAALAGVALGAVGLAASLVKGRTRPPSASAKEASPAEDQLKGNPRH